MRLPRRTPRLWRGQSFFIGPPGQSWMAQARGHGRRRPAPITMMPAGAGTGDETLSHRWELNPRPIAYEAIALPLSYDGNNNAQLNVEI